MISDSDYLEFCILSFFFWNPLTCASGYRAPRHGSTAIGAFEVRVEGFGALEIGGVALWGTPLCCPYVVCSFARIEGDRMRVDHMRFMIQGEKCKVA